MRVILFTDAHIHDDRTAQLVEQFLDEKSDVYFLGDMFDTPEDAQRFDGFLHRYDFSWIKGNHDFWMDLPEEADLGNVILAHGHKRLFSWKLEKYLVRFTPTARQIGLFGPAISFGRFFRDGIVEKIVGKIILSLSKVTGDGQKPVIMGHLHHLFVGKNYVVLPRFPFYAILKGTKIEIRNFLDEI